MVILHYSLHIFMCRGFILTESFETGPVDHLSWQLWHSCSDCNIILWGNSKHPSYPKISSAGVRLAFLGTKNNFLILEKYTYVCRQCCQTIRISTSACQGEIQACIVDGRQIELPQRITLQPLQPCHSCQVRWATGPTAIPLAVINHLHTRTYKYKAQVEKYWNSPLRHRHLHQSFHFTPRKYTNHTIFQKVILLLLK